MTLQLKPNPTIDALLQLRPRIRLKEFLKNNDNNPYNEFDKVRRQKILDYVERQEQKPQLELEEPTPDEERWIERKRWNKDRLDSKVIEVWVPWSRIDGEFSNIWRFYSKK